MHAHRSARARAALDNRFSQAANDALRARPHAGWIRAIRDALGMSQRELAARLRITGPAVAKFEQSEVQGTITLATLSKVAEALDCTLVYALVPRTSLTETLDARARKIAADELGYVATTMALEKQSIEDERLDQITEDRIRELIAGGHLWRIDPGL